MKPNVKCEKSGCTNKDCPHKEEHEGSPNCKLHCDTFNSTTTCQEVVSDVVG